MGHLFRREPDVWHYVSRAARILFIIPILLYLCLLPSHAGVPLEAQSYIKSSVNITRVMPEVVQPGDSIEISLDADLSKYYDDEINVFFDNLRGEILLRAPQELKVRVPKDLRPEDRVWVVVELPKFKTPPARIAVLPLPPAPMIETILSKFLQYPLYAKLIIIYIVAVIISFPAWLWLRSRKRARAMQQKREDRPSMLEGPVQEVSPIVSPTEVEPKLEPPQAPDELVAACQKGECIVFVGADINKPAGLPTWQEFVQGLLQWAMDKKILDPNLGSSYGVALQKRQADLVADGVASAVQTSEGSKDMLLKYLQGIFVSPSAQPTRAHSFLKQIGFAGALTINLDSLLENSLETPVFTPQDAEKLLPKLAEREPFVLKLFGTLERPETVQISPAQYRDKVADNRVFLEFVEKLLLSRTLLFVGTSLDGVQSNLEALGLRNVRRSHYALVGVTGSEWRAKAESLQRRFNVQTLPYLVSEEETALVNFLGGLATRMTDSRGAAKAAPQEPPCFKRVQLENIGPFEALDLQLDPKWNILLGDNGVGKSSILKAIALALCGKHAQLYANRLIKFGRPSGRIVLELTDGATNVTELYRTSAEPEIKVLSRRELLGTERWLAMGFPPLRQVGWTLPKGPQPKPGTPYTTPGDVLPLVIGDLDPRMTDLKQSILNFDYQSQSAGGERYRKLLDDFFDVIGQVTQGVTFRKGRIDRQTSQIFVETDDGEVPLAAVSQGTQSLMGWIGLLLERLYEVYDNTDRPREGPALVLIDEIDAHMHPFWQQTMVPHLSELFNNIQFIATTHSPLVVTEMQRNQVFVLDRDYETKKVFVRHADEDFTWFRADQILTSSLFSLPRSRGSKPAGDVARYSELMGMKVKDHDQERELIELRGRLESGLAYCDTPAGRKIEAAIRSTLSQIIIPESGLPGASQEELPENLRVKIRHQLAELLGDKKSGRER